MDDIDYAQRYDQEHLERALRNRKRPENGVPLVVDGVRVCRDCADPIPEARIAARPDADRCAYCQQLHERYGDHR